MSLGTFLEEVVVRLSQHGIPYMLAGSMVSTHYGRPRTTQDVDIVIVADIQRVRSFVRDLPTDRFYVSEAAALDAVRRRSMFNVIDMTSGWKVDLILRKDRLFSRAEFERRRSARILNVDVYMATPEDIILSKLEWAVRTGSDRQLEDVAAVVEGVGEDLDIAYVEEWVGALGLARLWQQVLERTGAMDS